MTDGAIGLVMLGILACFMAIGYGAGKRVGDQKAREWFQMEAISHRCADFAITDTLKGTTEFKWRTP